MTQLIQVGGDMLPKPATFEGFHPFWNAETGNYHGSFEVFPQSQRSSELSGLKPGFYWWACFPGCLPDGEPTGPFPTAEGAYLDAIGD